MKRVSNPVGRVVVRTPPRRAALPAAAVALLLAAGPLLAQPSSYLQRRWERFWQRPASVSKYHQSVKKAFVPLLAEVRRSTVSIWRAGAQVALGAVVDPEGYVVTKASELDGDRFECRFADGTRRPAEKVAADQTVDLALLKLSGPSKGPLPAVPWREGPSPAVGSWIVTPGTGPEPVSLGIVSVAERLLATDRGRRPSYGFLGISFDVSLDEPRIDRVYPGTGAARAGLRAGDVILAANGKRVASRRELQEILRRSKPGQTVKLHVERGRGHVDITAKLGQWLTGRQLNPQEHMGGQLSSRSTGFGRILQHDSALRPNQCGGPAVDSAGKVVGINIARAGRVESYVLPAAVVRTTVARLKRQAGKQAAQSTREKPAHATKPAGAKPPATRPGAK